MPGDQLFYIIVNRGRANFMLGKALALGATGGSIFAGEGTVPPSFWSRLGLDRTEKDVLMTAVPQEKAQAMTTLLRDTFKLNRKNAGIAFSVPAGHYEPGQETVTPRPYSKDNPPPYQCLITVLDKGKADECMQHARAAGAQGGTILKGRGAGVPQDLYFPIVIEPQKDVVLIVARHERALAVRRAIYDNMKLSERGRGILFALPVLNAIGLYEERGKEGKA